MNCINSLHCKLLKKAVVPLCMIFCISWPPSALGSLGNLNPAQILLVVGFDGISWHPYTLSLPGNNPIKQELWQKIDSVVNPVAVTRQPGSGFLFVKDNSGKVQRFTKSGEDPILFGEPSNYTQLRAHKEGLSMVQLLQGKSRETQLVTCNEEIKAGQEQQNSSCKPLFKQASAQFHPLFTEDSKGKSLFYGHVSCRLACDPVIQEVWRFNPVTNQAKQLTLLNATSYLHSVDKSGSFGFISSNYHGYYHISRLDLEHSGLTWLTKGRVTDSYPSIASNGELYFIRRTSKGTRLMKMNGISNGTEATDNNLPVEVALPEDVQKIRYLELSTL